MINRWRQYLLGAWARIVVDHPWPVLISAVIVAALAALYTAQNLGFQSDRNDLLSPRLAWNARYIQYRRQYESHDRVVIAVAIPQKEGGRARAEALVRELATRLEKSKRLEKVWWGFPQNEAMALLRLGSDEEVAQGVAGLKQAAPLLGLKQPSDLITAFTRGMSEQQDQITAEQAAGQIGQFAATLNAMEEVLAGRAEKLYLMSGGTSGAGGTSGGWQFLELGQKLLVIEIEVIATPGAVDANEAAVEEIRSIMAEVKPGYSDVEFGLTGIPVMEADETQISMRDATISSTIASLLILGLMVWAYRSLMMPVLSQAALMVGVALSYGFVTLAIGHLQVVSVVFIVILLGLGVDFGIHIISRFELIRHDYAPGLDGFRQAMVETLQGAGPGIITGALTTALAFSATYFTDFLAMAELGLIASVGVLLCLVTALTVLPALIRLVRYKARHINPPEHRTVDLHDLDWLMPPVRHMWITGVIALAVGLVGFYAMLQIRFDNNLMSLLPTGLDSLKWQDRIIAESDEALWYAVSTTKDVEEARRLSEAYRRLETVEKVGGAGLLFASDPARTQRIGAELRPLLALEGAAANKADSAAEFIQKLNFLRFGIAGQVNKAEVRAEPAVHAALTSLLRQIDSLLSLLKSDAFQAEAAQRMQKLQAALAGEQQQVRQAIETVSSDAPLKPADLPAILRREAVGDQAAGYQLKIYPRQDIWNPAELERFIRDVRGVDEQVTGSPIQIYESGELMKNSYRFAGILALLIVLTLVFVDFINFGRFSFTWGRAAIGLGVLGLLAGTALLTVGWREIDPWWATAGIMVVAMGVIHFGAALDSLMCLIPVTLGFLATFIVMHFTGESINPANVMILPLMFGIGVDNGVHIMHRYHDNRYGRPPGLTQATGKGIILTSMTAVIGFSSMLIAHHRGVRSLGFVLAVGMFLTLAASLFVMPAVLQLRNTWHAWMRLRQWRNTR